MESQEVSTSVTLPTVKLVPAHDNPDDIVTKLWDTVEQYQTELEDDIEVKEGIRSVVKEIDKVCKKINFGLMGIHSNPSDEKLLQIGIKARELLTSEMIPLLDKLDKKVPSGDYYKYNDIWRYSFQKVCAVCTITHYLLQQTLPTLKEVATYIGLLPVNEKKEGTIFLDYDEYLFGLLDLANELSRLCRNLITFGGRTEKTHQIHQMILDLSAAMHNITFKNDYLRKKYDGLKYQLKTIEEVIYDLKIQTMKTEQPNDVSNDNISASGDASVQPAPSEAS